jgi:phosphatidylserine/phosphatidylglycerophosphate/cardiolipin synthase-like enzyme
MFSELERSALEALASALETERITTGNPLTLQQCLPATACVAVGRELDDLIRSGIPPQRVAYTVRAVLHERDRSAAEKPSVELVWTGPEGTISSSRDTGVVVRELFMMAKRTIFIAGFAIHRGREIFSELAARMDEDADLEVKMFLNISRAPGDTTIKEQLIARFARRFRDVHWTGTRYPTIFYDPRALAPDEKKRTSLHAKCVVVDSSTSFVTSANFTEAAQMRNIEVGALVHDTQFARVLVSQFDTWPGRTRWSKSLSVIDAVMFS